MRERHERFCEEFVKNGDNATEAYKAAGYKADNQHSAESRASRLLRNDEVQNKIAELKEKVRSASQQKTILSVIERMEILSNIAQSEETSPIEKIKAIDTANKMEGVYIVKNQITGADGGPVAVNWEVAESGASYKAGNDSI